MTRLKMKDTYIQFKLSSILKQRWVAYCNLLRIDMTAGIIRLMEKEIKKTENKKRIDKYLRQQENQPKEYSGKQL